ncbi:hypothetical protein [Pontibacter ruber]|uniref:Lipoprotein n=1 Tax=Pontibacter ruber TaxID=1343895 RepID=A0ABW5D2P0_9BACT|nr:hypothetical protein [Pontibacter ruber]
MKKLLYCSLLLSIALSGCQSGTEEDKSLASTHPELEEQLQKDSLKAPATTDENSEIYERYRITTEEYQRAGTHQVPTLYRGRLAPLDEGSHADARTFRTALRDGLKQGVNFAGKYTVVTVGCGTSCQVHYVVDRESGKVLDKVQSSLGAAYNPNSSLFIVNPPDSTINYTACAQCTPEAYVFENGRFRKLSSKNAQEQR